VCSSGRSASFVNRMLCSVHFAFFVSIASARIFIVEAGNPLMSDSLFDAYGARKYIIPRERAAFVCKAMDEEPEFATFCLTLATTGARISEVLALDAASIDIANEGVVFRTLKQRGKNKFRLVPAPGFLLERL
jgi:integrase